MDQPVEVVGKRHRDARPDRTDPLPAGFRTPVLGASCTATIGRHRERNSKRCARSIMLHPSLAKFTDKAPEGCTGSRARSALGSCAFCPTKSSSLDGIGHPGHLELHGEANNRRLRSISSGR
jgi:hypothetical protein